jgi:hypothetical protein
MLIKRFYSSHISFRQRKPKNNLKSQDVGDITKKSCVQKNNLSYNLLENGF